MDRMSFREGSAMIKGLWQGFAIGVLFCLTILIHVFWSPETFIHGSSSPGVQATGTQGKKK